MIPVTDLEVGELYIGESIYNILPSPPLLLTNIIKTKNHNDDEFYLVMTFLIGKKFESYRYHSKEFVHLVKLEKSKYYESL